MAGREKPILLLDFDGVIHSYKSGWQGATIITDPPVPGFWDWAVQAAEHFDLQIYSARSSAPGGIEAMAGWLVDNKPSHIKGVSFGLPTTKPAAFLTIDDRAITFEGDWSSLGVERLLQFQPWNRR